MNTAGRWLREHWRGVAFTASIFLLVGLGYGTWQNSRDIAEAGAKNRVALCVKGAALRELPRANSQNIARLAGSLAKTRAIEADVTERQYRQSYANRTAVYKLFPGFRKEIDDGYARQRQLIARYKAASVEDRGVLNTARIAAHAPRINCVRDVKK